MINLLYLLSEWNQSKFENYRILAGHLYECSHGGFSSLFWLLFTDLSLKFFFLDLFCFQILYECRWCVWWHTCASTLPFLGLQKVYILPNNPFHLEPKFGANKRNSYNWKTRGNGGEVFKGCCCPLSPMTDLPPKSTILIYISYII